MPVSPFYVGVARWRSSVDATVEVLIQRLSQRNTDLVVLLTHPYGTPHDLGTQWRAVLAWAQNDCCFWCGRPMTAAQLSLEHVLPYRGQLWAHLSRMEQLLSLRLSHMTCNQDYRAWRDVQSANRLSSMDAKLVAVIRQAIQVEPLLKLYDQIQYHPERWLS